MKTESGSDKVEFNNVIKKLTTDRKGIYLLLQDKKWFKNTDPQIKIELLTIPEDFDGFLNDLANRPEEFGGLTTIKITKLAYGKYMVIPVFEVKSQNTNQIFTYEYTSFKQGCNPGYRGIILLEVDGEIKYFVLKKTTKFSVGEEVYDTIGGYIQFSKGQLTNLDKKIEDEIKRELGLDNVSVKRFIDLGQITTDITLTNKHSSLFAAVIDASNSALIKDLENNVLKTKKVSFNLVIQPISRIREYIYKVDDSFFLACVSRLLSMDIIKLN